MFTGGIADKLGNRYEAKWLVRQFLDVIGGSAQSVRFEGISKNFAGFEFVVRRNDVDEWHQTKINCPNGNWTLNSLKREGVLSAFKERLSASENDLCFFVSQDPAKDAGVLSEKAKVASDCSEFQETLGEGHADKFQELQVIWAVSPEVAFSWLRRSQFNTESQSSIESLISTFSDFYFCASDSSFEILREFLEARFNKDITTETARSELRVEEKLVLKDWSIDPTLKERLFSETSAYLETYSPFGAGGSKILRSEASDLTKRIIAPDGPKIILLTGVAGSGKSGVIREFVEALAEREVPHLALRIDQHLDCTSPALLGKAVTGREESPAATLKGIAPNQLSVLIVDQVDAVSEVSGRNGIVKQAVLRLVSDVRNFGGMAIVIACRTFDLESDQRLKGLKDALGVEHIDVQLLSWEDDVKPLLTTRSVDVDSFSEQQRALLCLPLNLAIFLEVHDGTNPAFASRNDLFARLLEKKGRSIRNDRQITWDIGAPLARLAEWMSERQKLDAPESILSEFAGAIDFLTSEGLIVRSRGYLNLFHESFFDYIYAQTFAARQKTLVYLLDESEQHLFRRTQVRQILETLRQTDVARYLQELRAVLLSEGVRYHIKVAITQWLGSLTDPTKEEESILLRLDVGTGSFPPLVRYAFFSSPGWFDRLLQDGWIQANLTGDNTERSDGILRWLSNIAGQRPTEVAEIMDKWWGGAPDRGKRLLDWFGFVKRQRPDDSLVDLCCRVTRSNPPGLFDGRQSNNRDLLLHTWAGENPTGAAKILNAYFDAWFEAHPNQHPFERDEFRDLDAHSLGEMAKKAPLAFVEGATSAFVRSVDLIAAKAANGKYDYSFKSRYYSGHNFGSGAFLEMFRESMRQIAVKTPQEAERFLRLIEPNNHEVLTHIWLETIAANGKSLNSIFSELFENSFLLDAGWHGADWKSFAEAAKATIPFLPQPDLNRLFGLISEIRPELRFAAEFLRRIESEGEEEPWRTKKSVLHYVGRSGYVQWCILETIGAELLGPNLATQLQQLRRKFNGAAIDEPHHLEAHWVQSPIKRDQAARMTDAHWLRAIERYDNDEDRRRGRTWVDGGARQLAGELQNAAKEEPGRFVALLEKIPDTANQAYISHLLWGLAETDGVEEGMVQQAIPNAHRRPNRPYGSDIARLIEKHPITAASPSVFEALAWYINCGDANDDDAVDISNTERELTKIEDLLDHAGRLHVHGINGARGWAAEALGNVIWKVPATKKEAWQLLERRASEERLVSVRCCLMRPAVPLFNDDRERCGALVQRLSSAPNVSTTNPPTLSEKAWLWLAFPSSRLPGSMKQLATWCAGQIDRLVRRRQLKLDGPEGPKWLSPLLTHQGVHLFPFMLHAVPNIARRLLYRLIATGDDTSRMIGAWHVFRESFHNSDYAALADSFFQNGVVYRRLLADVASHAVTLEEYRHRAEEILIRSFDDEDKQVRSQAGDVFREIKPNEFERFRELAVRYLGSKAFETNSWAFFHALEEAECRVDDIVISATETLMRDIERNGNDAGRRSMDLHQLQDIIKKEYASSESDAGLRRRLLDLIDRMLKLELYGVDTIIKAHER